MFVFFNDTATTEIYTLSLHDALPISPWPAVPKRWRLCSVNGAGFGLGSRRHRGPRARGVRSRRRRRPPRSEEHTSELQSRQYLVCRLLLEKKKKFISAH